MLIKSVLSNFLTAGGDIEIEGVLECGHKFCYPCIMDWSKVNNHCPLCKMKFNQVIKIDKKQKIEGQNGEKVGFIPTENGQNYVITPIQDVPLNPAAVDSCKI